MNKLLVIVMATLALCGTAAETNRVSIIRRGGMLMRPGTPKGKIMVFNCQKRLAHTNLVMALNGLGKDFTKWDIICSDALDPKGDFAGAKERAKADIAVFIVSDATTPSLLQAPDDCWVAINLAKLDRNLKTPEVMEKFYASRCRKQIMRAVALACGAAGSDYPGNVMDVTKIEDLDLVREMVPLDKSDICDRYLKDSGFKPKQLVPYLRACREGWAPAPTNDVQKQIWDKVHALPTKPIAIEPESKAQQKTQPKK